MSDRTIQEMLRRRTEALTPNHKSLEVPVAEGSFVLEPRVLTVPPPAMPDEADVDLQVLAWLAEAWRKPPRPRGDTIQPDDEPTVDMIAYSAGHVVPMSAKEALTLDEDTEPFMPGFRARLNGKTVGESHIVHYTFPEDYPIEGFRNKQAIYAVDVRDVFEPSEFPEEQDNETMLTERAGFPDLETMRAAAQFFLEDAERQALAEEALALVLQPLLARVQDMPMPDELIEAEIGIRWDRAEGRMLRERKLPNREQLASREYWLKHPDNRREVTANLRRTAVLMAIARDNPIPEEMLMGVPSMLFAGEADLEASIRSVVEDKNQRAQLVTTTLLTAALEFLISTVSVTFEGSDADPIPLSELMKPLDIEALTSDPKPDPASATTSPEEGRAPEPSAPPENEPEPSTSD